ncbi:hypothetical protein SNEBB_000189 [Seison nebaliae]|nr:hypothetical protein SNEBB_000189 [Seison nebaliae]
MRIFSLLYGKISRNGKRVLLEKGIRKKKWEKDLLSVTSGKKERNIGIFAHVDAGKTTISEHFLYSSGIIDRKGNVDDGSTVTDYNEIERQRGITIEASSISFPWKSHRINLIDTPGHVDFFYDVQRSLIGVDGIVLVIDGIRGIQTQTKSIYRLIVNHPMMIIVNKIDRKDFWKKSFENCLKGIENLNNEKKFVYPFQTIQFKNDKLWKIGKMEFVDCERFWSLLEFCVMNSEEFSEKYFENVTERRNLEKIDRNDLRKVLRNLILECKLIPLYLCSGRRGDSIEMVLDGIVEYLPNSLEHQFTNRIECPFYYVYKVKKEQQRLMLFTRLFQYGDGGEMANRSVHLSRVNGEEKRMQIQQLYLPISNEYLQVEESNNYFVMQCTHSNQLRSGQFLMNCKYSLNNEMRRRIRELEKRIHPSSSVAYCRLEAENENDIRSIQQIISDIQLEDPTLEVKEQGEMKNVDDIVIGSQGELHLEVVTEKIRRRLCRPIYPNEIEVALKEKLCEATLMVDYVHKVWMKGKKYEVKVKLEIVPIEEQENVDNDLVIEYIRSKEESFTFVSREMINSISQTIRKTLCCGPKVSAPMLLPLKVNIFSITFATFTPMPILTSAIANTVRHALTNGNCVVLEPYMSIDVDTPANYMTAIRSILQRRNALSIDMNHLSSETKTNNEMCYNLITCAPLSSLNGITNEIRSISQGFATITMKFEKYLPRL